MTNTISADYSLRPSELASTLALLVEARQPVVVWGAPGCAKSQIAQQVAAQAGREYVDVRALLLDPVDLRGIPWRDGADRTRWAPPAFLPPSDADGSWLINLEELPSALPMVQAALYQLVLDRKCGEYELPEGAALIACGNREGDRGVVHRMPAPLASRFVHLEIRVDATDWCAWGAANGIAPEVLFFVSMRPELLHAFNPQSAEKAFPCPRTWEMVSNIPRHFPRLRHVFADGAYAGPKLEGALKRIGRWSLEIVNRPAGVKGFQLLPRRWVVERTLAWLNRNRRLAKDFETAIETAEAWIFLASIQLLTRRLARA